MPSQQERKILALAKKNAAKAVDAAKPKPSRRYDATLPSEEGKTDEERERFFKEMKRREF
jgi:hypothetical protein